VMYAKTMLSYTTLVGLLITTSGCMHLPPYRMKRKKVVLTKPNCPTTTFADAQHLAAINDSLATHIDIENQKPTITIWIHGTRLLPNPVFQAYMYSPAGLNPITDLDKSFHLRQLADAIINADPQRYPLDHFYIFGWSGKLDADVRKQAAEKLYAQLLQLIESYEQKNKTKPDIRIITHSHGGNIALHLADMNTPTKPVEIQELILLACPVQEKTMHHIKNDMFKKTYALYSSLDMLQVLAPQFMYRIERKNSKKHKTDLKLPLFSARRFAPEPKLAQIKIKINGHAIFHTTFTSANFTRLLPKIIDEINAWQMQEPQYPFDKPDTRRLMSIYA